MRQLEITTSDQVTFHLVAAGLGTRAAAWLVDQALLILIRIAMLVALSLTPILNVEVVVPLFLMLDLLYFTWYEWKMNGQTPGKSRYRLRVVSIDGGSLSFQAVFIRNVVRMLDSLPQLMLVGGATAWFDPLGRRLGDLAAGTMVVREGAGSFSPPPADRDRPNTFHEDPACRRRIMARATREDRDLAVELMWRRDALEPGARHELFHHLAGDFLSRFSLPEVAGLSEEQIVMDVALILADRDLG